MSTWSLSILIRHATLKALLYTSTISTVRHKHSNVASSPPGFYSFRLGNGARYAWAAMMSGLLRERAYACSTIGEESDLMTLPMDMKNLKPPLAFPSR